MDPNSIRTVGAAAGASGIEPLYVEDVFSTDVYKGTSDDNETGPNQPITNGIDLSSKGGLVWTKQRQPSQRAHHLYSSNFTDINTQLSTDSNDSAQSSSFTGMVSFNSDGFTLGPSASTNYLGDQNVAWTFRKAKGFFDIVAYEGNNPSGQTVTQAIDHNLGSAPGMIIVKSTSNASNWAVYHTAHNGGNNPEQYYTTLDNIHEEYNDVDNWGDTLATSTQFTVGANNNADGVTYVAYLFANGNDSGASIFGENEDQSIIATGGYSGSTTINCGWEPQWVMVKRRDDDGAWGVFDYTRGFAELWSTNSGQLIEANTNTTESESGWGIGPYANGLKTNGGTYGNDDYIWIAIRRPMKKPTAATEVFAMDYGNSSNTTTANWISNFVVDASLWCNPDLGSGVPSYISSRITGKGVLNTFDADDRWNDGNVKWAYMNGWGAAYSSSYLSYMFKRAPGFFDVVAYQGTGSATWHYHNLEKKPEMMIVKRRDADDISWKVYHHNLNSNIGTHEHFYLELDHDSGDSNTDNIWDNTEPTTTQFRVGSDNHSNGNTDKYVNWLFASLDGISDVGYYTGATTGESVEVNCGFEAGARFVLIKRADSSGGWYLFD